MKKNAMITPKNQYIFDPWNSASTGHQQADNTYSRTIEWRQTRTEKLAAQFRGGNCIGNSGDILESVGTDYSGRYIGHSHSGNDRREGVKKGAGEWRWMSRGEVRKTDLGCEDIRKYMLCRKTHSHQRYGEGNNDNNKTSSNNSKNNDPSNVGGGSVGSVDDVISKKRKLNDNNNNSNDDYGLRSTKRGKEEQQQQQQQQHAATSRPCSPPAPLSLSYRRTITSIPLEQQKQKPRDEPAEGPKQEQNVDQGKKSTSNCKLFTGLTMYINGSTAPLISDHYLKHLLVENGANISISLSRRTAVTHVILGHASAAASSPLPSLSTAVGIASGPRTWIYRTKTETKGAGAGGGLAAGKLQNEISRSLKRSNIFSNSINSNNYGLFGASGGGKVKFVTVEWVLESLRASKRLPETRFQTVRLAGRSQGSLFDSFLPATTSPV